jgi:D-alanyl-D-alanine carboxypeptidase
MASFIRGRNVESLAVAVLAVGLLGACSSSDSTSSDSTAPTSVATSPAPTESAAPVTSTATSTASTAPSTTTAPTSDPSEPSYASFLRSTLSGLVDSMKVPSAVVLVRSSTYGDATFSFGSLVLGQDHAPGVTDHYRIGSNTKTMTATIVLQLAEEGKVALSDSISKYRPDVPNGANITIAQLLDMRSGLASYDEDPAFLQALDADRNRVWQPEELLAMSFAQPPLFAPGAQWHYSNVNYILLGVVMEQVTGQSAPELFQQRVFHRLGMENTVMPELTDSSLPQPFAHGYLFGSAVESASSNGVLPADQQQAAAAGTLLPDDWTDMNLSWGWTAGSVISTADDLAVYVAALVDGGLLDTATQQERLASIQQVEAGSTVGYGLGLMKVGSYYGHNGQIPGYEAFMVRDPDTRTSVIVMTSLTSAPDGKLPADTLGAAVIAALADAGGATSTTSTSAPG